MIHTEIIHFTRTNTGEQKLPPLKYDADASRMLMIFVATNSTTTTATPANAALMRGMSDGNGNQGVTSAIALDNVGTTSVGTTHHNAACIRLISTAGAEITRAAFDRLEDNQIVLNWATASATVYQFSVLVIYGPDIEAFVGYFAQGTTLGNYAVNAGLSLEDGDTVLCFTAYSDTIDDNRIAATQPIIMQLGMACRASEQYYTGMFVTYNTTTPNLNATRQINGKLFSFFDTTTLYSEAEFLGFNATGFDYEMTTASGSASYVFYAVLKGARGKLIDFNSKTGSVGLQVTQFCEFTPKSVLFSTNHINSSASTRVNRADQGMSFTTLKAKQVSYGCVIGPQINTRADSYRSPTAYVAASHTLAGAITLPTIAEFVSFDEPSTISGTDGGFTLDYTLVSTARNIVAWAIGDAPPTVAIFGETQIFGETHIY